MLGLPATLWHALLAPASAAPCPDVEVTFARATTEPPGVGVVGKQFVDSLRSQVGGRSVAVYPVNYPATYDYAPRRTPGQRCQRSRSGHGRELSQHQDRARWILPGRVGDRPDHHRPSTGCGFRPRFAAAGHG
ncbi:cutinase family protein [Mycobacterium xenopi 4042]|uniref:Cutinase family protein n=1 Tax=Mycobacterium xenopi 4042 TaxID=1299334 RepID=X8DEB3_MYCXE|nr:cutinase family protein [Mycobacterium xenopi 4042]